MALERSVEEQKLEHYRETMDRLTAAAHVKTEYFADHEKIEGYYENPLTGNFFSCDRLMKQENMFGTIQLGYNPNRERVFLFARLKTSRYDTVASRYQKEMKEYQKRALLKGDNENRAYVSRRWENAAVLIEKKENKPWTQRSVKTYLKRASMEAAQKTLPFFSLEEEREDLAEQRDARREGREEIRKLQLAMSKVEESENAEQERREQAEEIRAYRRADVERLTMENLLEAIISRKQTASKHFLRKMNYAYDYQKKDIETYYREKRKTLEETAEQADDGEDIPEDEDR